MDNTFDIAACNHAILSSDYYDFVVQYTGIESIQAQYNPTCIQVINEHFAVVHGRITDILQAQISQSPLLLSPLMTTEPIGRNDKIQAQDLSAIEESGISPLFFHPFLQLRGTGTLIAFLDSGIDYTHPAFVYEDNTSKILSIWDQTIEGNPPSGFYYGSEYTREQINEALSSDNPASIVPSTDESGHGTFLAGVAAGRMVTGANFTGAAPNAELIVVKLKQAKQYLRDLYVINDDATVYQSNDLMLGIRYCIEKANQLELPLVICISLGTNLGGHDGRTTLEEYINIVSTFNSISVVTAAGNETTLSRHAMVQFSEQVNTARVNLRVGPNEPGFTLQIWGRFPDVFSVGVITPSGESIQQIPARLGERDTISFILEPTRILIEYNIIEERTGDPLVIMRFTDPSEGIWTINLVKVDGVNQPIHLWLPCCNWISENTYFIEANADTTIMVPGTTYLSITVAGYNHRTNGMFIYSSRGNTRYDSQNPDFAAPAVNVYGPLPNNTYGNLSGTSIAAAISSGAIALLLQWGSNRPGIVMNAVTLKSLITKGASRRPNLQYPNKESGFGILNLQETFNTLRIIQ